MKYLLDTCVISELMRQIPSSKVIEWITSGNENDYYLSVLTLGEVHKGIEKLAESKRKEELHNWVENELKERFDKRIIEINLNVAATWGKLLGIAEKKGKPMPAVDALIAATGKVYHMTVVTRNTSDIKESGVQLFNPWK